MRCKQASTIQSFKYYQLLFPDIRETGATPLRQCQLVMLRMLKVFNHLSKKHGFQYWLDQGTLLGAVRHGGFIPWDCDLDIAMPRADYRKFVRYAAKELPDDIFFQTTTTDPFYPKIAIEGKLRDKYSSYTEWAGKNPECKHHNGLMIDIAVYDHLVSETVARLYNLKGFQRLRQFLIKRLKSSCFSLNPGQLPGADLALTQKDVFPLHYLEFEGSFMPCPNNYEKYLTFLYGDYKTLPPQERQIPPEGEASAFIACDHKEALHWERRLKINRK